MINRNKNKLEINTVIIMFRNKVNEFCIFPHIDYKLLLDKVIFKSTPRYTLFKKKM